MVLVDGGQFLFFSQDSDSFSGKGANRLFSLCYLHIDLQLLRDHGGGEVGLLGDHVLLELVPDGLGPEDGVIKLVLGFGLGPFLKNKNDERYLLLGFSSSGSSLQDLGSLVFLLVRSLRLVLSLLFFGFSLKALTFFSLPLISNIKILKFKIINII